MSVQRRELVKAVARATADVMVVPAVVSFWIRSLVLGRDRALEGSTQALALLPGLWGQYLRRAFLRQVLAECHPTATIEYGTLFSGTGARIGANVYIGPNCHVGLVDIGRDTLIGAGVHLPSGRATHGTADWRVPIRQQPGIRTLVRIGAGCWIGSAAVIMADVGSHAVVGAGAVVTTPIPDYVVAAGVPARVVRRRQEGSSATKAAEPMAR